MWTAGIRHFDTASLGEIEIVKGLLPDAICHFMAPVRLPGQAKAAFEKHGVTDFVVDSDSELDKLLAETGNPKKLRIFVRLVAQLGGALLEMSSKYGCRPEEAAKLLKRVRRRARSPASPSMSARNACRPFPMPRRSRSPSAPSPWRAWRSRRWISAAVFPPPMPDRSRRPITGIST